MDNQQIDIAYIVSHGFAARMVMQTNLLGQLVESGKKVALIAPDRTDTNLMQYCEKSGVSLHEFDPKSTFWTNQYTESRKYFLENISNNTALLEKHMWAIKNNSLKNPINYLRPRVLYGIYKLIQYFPFIKKWYKKRELKHITSQQAIELINRIDPKILISTYPVSFSEAMLLKAGNDRTATKTIIHLLSWDNITCKGHFPQLADEYIAWGPIMKEEFIEYYDIDPSKIHICGVPHFDIHDESKKNANSAPYLKALGLNPEKPYLFFGMSSPRFAPKEIDIVEWLADEIKKNTFGVDLQLVIRPHPQNVQGVLSEVSWLTRLNNLNGGKVAVDFPNFVPNSNMWLSMESNDMEKLSRVLSQAKICLNSGSTLSIDSLIMDIPVILTAFDGAVQLEYWKSAVRLMDYPHIQKLLKINNISVAHNYNALQEQILEKLINPIKENNINLEVSNIGYSTTSLINLFNDLEKRSLHSYNR